MSNSSVISNTKTAIDLINGASLVIDNCTFFNNSTPDSAGAIECQGSVMKMVNTKFNQNRAVHCGGAVDIYEMSKLFAHNCSFTHNIADSGAICVVDSNFLISDSNFSDNFAANGGAVRFTYGYLVITNCKMSDNTARGDGGVIFGMHVRMLNCLVFNNTVNANGGVVISKDSETFITTSIFKMNTAFEGGGAFFVMGE